MSFEANVLTFESKTTEPNPQMVSLDNDDTNSNNVAINKDNNFVSKTAYHPGEQSVGNVDFKDVKNSDVTSEKEKTENSGACPEPSKVLNTTLIAASDQEPKIKNESSEEEVDVVMPTQKVQNDGNYTEDRNLIFSREELIQLSQGNIERIDVELIAKFGRLCDTNGSRLFAPLEEDRQLRAFFRTLGMAEIEYEKKLRIKSATESNGNDDEWENEGEDENGFAKARTHWKKLKSEKRQIVLNVMCKTASLLITNLPSSNAGSSEQRFMENIPVNGNILDRTTDEETSVISDPSSPTQLSASKGRATPSVVAEAGLFSHNFDWEKLPAALKTVYDKQGHRQEVIDGATFWKFLSKCTAIPKTKDQSGFEPDPFPSQSPGHEDDAQEDEQMTSEQFMEMLSALMQKARHEEHDAPIITEVEETGEKRIHQNENRVDIDNDDGCEDDDEYEDEDEESNNDDGEEKREAIAQFIKELQESGNNDVGMQLLMQLMGGNNAAGMMGLPEPQEDSRSKKLEEFLAERRNDTERPHLADIWEQVLKKDEEEFESRPQTFSKSFGLHARVRAWRAKRKERKQMKAEAME